MNLLRLPYAVLGAIIDRLLPPADIQQQAVDRAYAGFAFDAADALNDVEAAGDGLQGSADEEPGEVVFDAVDRNAVELLKLDPDAYFRITKTYRPRSEQSRRIAQALAEARAYAPKCTCPCINCMNQAHWMCHGEGVEIDTQQKLAEDPPEPPIFPFQDAIALGTEDLETDSEVQLAHTKCELRTAIRRLGRYRQLIEEHGLTPPD